MTTQTPTLEDQRVSLTPAGYAAGREQDACAVLCAMLTSPQSGAHYRALRRTCRNVSGEDLITTARLLEKCRQHCIYLSGEPLGRSMIENLAFSLAFLSLKQPYANGYTFTDLINYGARIGNLGRESWAALYELATAALVWDRSGALAF